MPLTDEEWIAFINEYNGMVDDVGRYLETLAAACEEHRRGVARADGREAFRPVVWRLTVVVGVQSRRIKDRIKALSRRINEMRAMGEL